jgi:aromatic ring-opening dioxygenase catalytic subunit (LigB family)
MADLVGIYAASHGPLIARDWEKLPSPLKTRLSAAFGEIGRRLRLARVDAIIGLAPDHWTNFFLDNLPALCIGLGEQHDPPPEPFLAEFRAQHPTIAGAPALARHILATALARDFEPAHSHHLRLDHGLCLPLARLDLTPLPQIVPILINELEPPMPSFRRCFAWGRLLREAIQSFDEPLRVAILATGGLSHSIGEPTMGAIDEAFDRRCIAAFEAGEEAKLLDVLDAGIAHAGNGAHEVRNWLVAHAAARGQGFERLDYIPAPELYLGCAFAAWQPK